VRPNASAGNATWAVAWHVVDDANGRHDADAHSEQTDITDLAYESYCECDLESACRLPISRIEGILIDEMSF